MICSLLHLMYLHFLWKTIWTNDLPCYLGIIPFWFVRRTICELSVCGGGGPGAGPLRGCKGVVPPCLRKFLYLMGIRYAISFPVLYKTCSVGLLTPNYWVKTWLSTEKLLLKMNVRKTDDPSFSSSKKLCPPPLSAHQKSHGPPHILPAPSSWSNERSLKSEASTPCFQFSGKYLALKGVFGAYKNVIY